VTAPAPTTDVIVVGGGVIGLAVAWRAAQQGLTVTVVDPTPGGGATHVAAGMLAPVTEVHYGEQPLLALNLESAGRWPAFAAELEHSTGRTVGYRDDGTLAVALDDDDARVVGELAAFQRELGLLVESLRSRECRELEPLLHPSVRGGLLVAADHQVDNRAVARALLAACDTSGVRMVGTRVTALEPGGRVHCDDGMVLAAGTVVLAAGWQSPALAGIPVRPVKGQILRLRFDPGAPPLRHVVRGFARGLSVYLVPRVSGELVVGATVEEQGADTTVTAGAVHELLRAAVELVPAVAELELVEARAGLRPGTPDNAPLIGTLPGREDVIIATGHFRNGILLTPVTAEAVVQQLTTGRWPNLVVPFTPDRFAGAELAASQS
jgi:glycine oxidase